MTLEETSKLMLSNDYKERFIAEYWQTKIRFDKLRSMLTNWDNNELDFVPTCPRATYDFQVRAMKEYIGILEIRAKLEGIVL